MLGQAQASSSARDVPRPRSMQLYTFGSPRVGNDSFAALFATLPLQVRGCTAMQKVANRETRVWHFVMEKGY